MPSGASTRAIKPPRPPTTPVSFTALTERPALSFPRKIGVNGSRRPFGSYAIGGRALLVSGSFGRTTGAAAEGAAGATATGGGGGVPPPQAVATAATTPTTTTSPDAPCFIDPPPAGPAAAWAAALPPAGRCRSSA